jgi:uncharacterized protein YxjI
MRNLWVNQELFSLRGTYWVEDEQGNQVYQVVGSFMQVPKEFYVCDTAGNHLATVTHKVVSLLPQFFVSIGGSDVAIIRKKLSFIHPKYEIEGVNSASLLQVQGNVWDLSYQILWDGVQIGEVNKKWVSVRDRYMVQISDDRFELLVIALVLAIDYVKDASNS